MVSGLIPRLVNEFANRIRAAGKSLSVAFCLRVSFILSFLKLALCHGRLEARRRHSIGDFAILEGHGRKSAMQIAGRSDGGLHSAQPRNSANGGSQLVRITKSRACQTFEMVRQMNEGKQAPWRFNEKSEAHVMGGLAHRQLTVLAEGWMRSVTLAGKAGYLRTNPVSNPSAPALRLF
jgi:hypothetical protein